MLSVSFSGADAGVGLWKSSESGHVNFNPGALSYGVASTADCSDFSWKGMLEPQETEPFNLSFQFSDASQNGKYLCILLKDKLGNGEPYPLPSQLNLDIGAPVLSPLADLNATQGVVITPIIITGTDNGTIASWTVT